MLYPLPTESRPPAADGLPVEVVEAEVRHVHDDLHDFALLAAHKAAAMTGTAAPAVRWCRRLTPELRGFYRHVDRMAVFEMGARWKACVFPDRPREVWVRSDVVMTPWAAAESVAHEVHHLALRARGAPIAPDEEAAADAFAGRVVAALREELC
jgi:hypothetical protein